MAMINEASFKRQNYSLAAFPGCHIGALSSNRVAAIFAKSLKELAHPIRFERVTSAFGGCGRLTIDEDGYEISKKYNVSTRDGWGKYVKTLAKNCGKKGVTVGGSSEFAERTLKFTVQFFKDNL